MVSNGRGTFQDDVPLVPVPLVPGTTVPGTGDAGRDDQQKTPTARLQWAYGLERSLRDTPEEAAARGRAAAGARALVGDQDLLEGVRAAEVDADERCRLGLPVVERPVVGDHLLGDERADAAKFNTSTHHPPRTPWREMTPTINTTMRSARGGGRQGRPASRKDDVSSAKKEIKKTPGRSGVGA